jgi:hypothetical protein
MIHVEDLPGCGHGSRAVQNLGVSRDPGSLVTQTVLRINRQYMPCFHFRVRLFTQCPFSPGKPAFRKTGISSRKGNSRTLPDGDTLLSLLQGAARAQGRNVSGTRRKGSTLIRKICGIRLKGCPAKTLDRRAGGSVTCAIRRLQQPTRNKEGAGCRNPAKLPSEKYLLAQPTIVSRGRRQCHDRFRQ